MDHPPRPKVRVRFYPRFIQVSVTTGAGWTGEFARRQHIAVPLVDLTDTELATAAQACRAMANQEGRRAQQMENPTVRAPIEAAAQRYAALAKKLEAARGKG